MCASASKPLSYKRAMSCVFINLCVTPGLGSLIGGRVVAGVGQLMLSVTGCVLVVVWFGKLMVIYYSQMSDQPKPPQLNSWLALWGLGLFGAGWLWALVSSLGIYRKAQRQGLESGPPALSEPPRIR